MATEYRIVFRDWDKAIVGRDEFHADDDVSAMVIGQLLAEACADRCAEFELWQGSRRVDASLAKAAVPSFDRFGLSRTETIYIGWQRPMTGLPTMPRSV